MNIQEITKILIDSGIEPNEARTEIKILLENCFNYTEKDKILGKTLDEENLKILEELAVKRVVGRIPVQYITGKAYFMGEYYKVTPDVLIPRDETEILVRKAIEKINKNDYKDVLDIGTGSGCIACAIAKKTSACVLGVDISSDALRVALDNVTSLGINNRVVFRKSNLFEKIHGDEKFDLIISNPPYIPYSAELEPEVLKEPEIALRAGEDGLEFYKKIINQAPDFLKPCGWLLFELGLGESVPVKNLLLKKGFEDIISGKDLAGIDRVISARYRV